MAACDREIPVHAGGLASIGAMQHPNQFRTLRQRILNRFQDVSVNIAQGYPGDWGAYREQVGLIRGLDEALTILTEYEKEVEKR